MNEGSRPKGMYTRAFMRASAESGQTETPEPPQTAALPPPTRPRERRRRRIPVPIVGVLLTVGVVSVAILAWTRRGTPEDAPRVPAMRLVRVTPAEAGASTGAPTPSPEPRRPSDNTVATTGPAPAPSVARPSRTADGELMIESEPAGARVTVNGIGWGVTPLRIRYLPFGSKHVRVIKDGYVSADRSVSLDSTKPSARVRVKLRAR